MKNEMEKAKEKLEIEKGTLVEELSGLGIRDPKNGDWEATPVREESEVEESDENDLATIAETYDERHATLSVLEERLRDINAALQKISDGTYGTCEVCNEPISTDRLEANPAARTCIAHITA